MKIIKPSVEEFIQGAGFDGMLKHIERCGRLCYKSEDRITEGSAEKFVNMLKKHAHGAMLEHGTVYLTVPGNDVRDMVAREGSSGDNTNHWLFFLRNLPYSKCIYKNDNYYITTNYRVIIENKLIELMEEYATEPTCFHEKRRTFYMVCDRGVSHEFVRHRVSSFAQESQRYVAYDKEKYGSEIKFIKPLFFEKDTLPYAIWMKSCSDAESAYMTLRANGVTAQEARTVLPNSTATGLIMTQFESDWEHFFMLRCAKDAHPQAQEVANMIRKIYYSNLNTGVSLNFCNGCPKFEARKKVALAQSDSVFDMAVDMQDFVLDCQKTCNRIGVNKDE